MKKYGLLLDIYTQKIIMFGTPLMVLIGLQLWLPHHGVIVANFRQWFFTT